MKKISNTTKWYGIGAIVSMILAFQVFAAEDINTLVYSWASKSPDGGFISSIAIAPSNSSFVWASGDDSSGIYKSTDSGATWTLNTNVPVNFSSYSIVIDPTDYNKVYVPSHFGRGVLKTTNGGTNWSVVGTGLPTATLEKRLNQMVIVPNSVSTMYAATEGGLYKSTDSAANFSKITSGTFTNEDFRAVEVLVSGGTTYVFVGNKNGRVYSSTNGGTSWTAITTTDYPAVTALSATTNALYMGFMTGLILKTTNFATSGLSVVNDPSTGAIQSGMWTKIAAFATGSTDTVRVGTTYTSGTKWGFFTSYSGASFTQENTGLDSSSIMSLGAYGGIASAGTINNGIYKQDWTTKTWSSVSSGLKALNSNGFAQDPNNANHILMSSTAGVLGTSKVLKSTDGGTTWTRVTNLDGKDVYAIKFITSDIILASSAGNAAGNSNAGIWRTTTGSGGTWSQVLTKNINIAQFVQDKVTSSKIYASTEGYATDIGSTGDRGVYYSSDSGATWTQKMIDTASPIKKHIATATQPGTSGVAVAVGTDAYVTANSFTTSSSLGLSTYAPGKTFISAAFVNSSVLLVGTTTGQLYVTTNFSTSGSVTWQTVTIPAVNVVLNDIVVTTDGKWYIACFNADVRATSTSTTGLLVSYDQGVNWAFENTGLFPGNLIWKIAQDVGNASLIWSSMWGGGLFKYTR